jgi:hypothetical protein
MMSKRIKNIFKWLLFCGWIAYAIVSSAAESLVEIHGQAVVSYKKGDIYGAYQKLNSFFSSHDYVENESGLSDQKYAEILNDYAFFMEKYYDRQALEFCRTGGATATDFLTFRSSLLGGAKELLTFVTQLQPDRSVAYLNLADVLYELDEDDEAELSYRKYASLYSGKKGIMPRRVMDPSARKKLYRCR